MTNQINKKEIEKLLPHRDPMLLIDRLINIIPLKSATGIVIVKKDSFFVQGHFPDQPVMPGVMIVEAFGQAAAALTAHGIDPADISYRLPATGLYYYAFELEFLLLLLIDLYVEDFFFFLAFLTSSFVKAYGWSNCILVSSSSNCSNVISSTPLFLMICLSM